MPAPHPPEFRCSLVIAYGQLYYYDFTAWHERSVEVQRLGGWESRRRRVRRRIRRRTRDMRQEQPRPADEAVAFAIGVYQRAANRGDRFCAAFCRAIELRADLLTRNVVRAAAHGTATVLFLDDAAYATRGRSGRQSSGWAASHRGSEGRAAGS